MLIRFRVHGNFRFLSHSETISVFQRACVRAGIKIKHSQGFNPHPRMSLTLPRSVGVESEDELLYIETVCPPDESADCQSLSQIETMLSHQLPDGCELFEVSAAEKKDRPQATMATYLFAVKEQYFSDELKNRAKCLLASEQLNLQRKKPLSNSRLPKSASKHKIKEIDVRPFLESIEFENRNIIVECRIQPNGSIRIDEILKLMELDTEKLAAPIKRTKVEWQKL